MIAALISVYSFIVLAAVLLSFFPQARDNQLARYVEAVTEPVFERIRRVVPPLGGFDLSPMVLLIGLQILKRLIG
ncbi:MAG TPA: YggT family protein [Polyangiaceae bacterium]|jgi:YggT family protein|nr:YggT family protein [Polyangiaceae bacterium]